jgi:UDP-N-acetylglucosamine acyltransferase
MTPPGGTRSGAPATVDPRALIDPGAELGEGVTVGPYAMIGPHVRVGDRTTVGAFAVVEGDTILGEENRVFHHAAIGGPPQDLKYRGARSLLRIGDRNTFREFSTVNTATAEGEATVIGSDGLFMAYAHVAHNCVLGDHVILANSANLAGHVTIEDYAIVGGVTPVHQFVRIGRHAMIGGGSRVPQDVLPYVRAAGNPIRVVGLNTVGLERRGFSPEVRRDLKQAYHLFFRSGLTAEEAVLRMRAELPASPELTHLIEFIGKSERGFSR